MYLSFGAHLSDDIHVKCGYASTDYTHLMVCMTMSVSHPLTHTYFSMCFFSANNIQFRFSICEEVDHMMDVEVPKPLSFNDITPRMCAEQLTLRDAVSVCVCTCTCLDMCLCVMSCLSVCMCSDVCLCVMSCVSVCV